MKSTVIFLIFLLVNTSLKAEQPLVNYFFEAAKIGENKIIKEFLSHGFPVDHRNSKSYTALMMAAYHGQTKSVELLLNSGANPCLKDKRGHTAIMGAILKAEWPIVKRLYQVECKITYSRGKSLKEFASRFGQLEKLESLKKLP